MDNPTTEHVFIASWDSLGFEAIIDITKMERKFLMAALKNEQTGNLNTVLRNMILRARFNPQRFPQIWSFRSNVGEDDLWHFANEHPQALANLIKEHGEKIFGDAPQKSVIV